MNAQELKRALKKAGCTFSTRGKGGHITAYLGDKSAIIPTHGSNKELGTGLVNKIYKDLGLKK